MPTCDDSLDPLGWHGTAPRSRRGRFHGASLQCAKCRSPAVCTGIRPACYNMTAAGARGESLHSVGLTCRVGKVVSAALGSPDELVDRLTDTSANVLILFGSAVAKIPCRIEHSLAKR